MTDPQLWHRERPRLLALAYRITGIWADAEDAVSEAFLRLTQHAEVVDHGKWLTTVTARAALDLVRSPARARTNYIGPWLPDVVDPGDGPEADIVLAEDLDRAMVRLVQELTPVDRVIVVLVDVAGLTSGEAAQVVGLTPAAVRQRLSRARRSLAAAGDPVQVLDDAALRLLAGHLASGDLSALTSLLSEGSVLWTDSNGTGQAARRPILGADKIARFLARIVARYGMPDLSVARAVGGAVLFATSPDMLRALTLEIREGRITGIQIQQNPRKISRRGVGRQSRSPRC